MDTHSSEPTATPALSEAEEFEANPDVYAGDSPTRRACPERSRRDGWTPFARRLFLEVMAETGRVSLACDYCGLTKQSAYALRARDPLFAAGWDAACELARGPLADALYEKALDGVTDTITRNGEVVATRHRFDSRLSIAVLHRLDKRCDRAEERGSHHLALVRRWDEWLGFVGKGEEEAARAILEPVLSGVEGPARLGQLGQLPESENPTEEEALDLSDRCWFDEREECWMTDFPPPSGFTGYESRPYDEIEDDEPYVRACTEEEVAILEADAAADRAAERAEDEALRDAWFALLRAECSAHEHGQHGVLTERSADAERRLSSTESCAEPASGSPTGEPD